MLATGVRQASAPQRPGTVIKAFAHRLRAWRLEAGLPLKHVARDLGVSVSIVCEWEHGHRFPNIAHLEALANTMGLPVCCLVFHGHGHCPHSGRASEAPARGGRSRRAVPVAKPSC